MVRLGKEIDQRLRDVRPNARRVDDRRQFLCSPDGELFLALADGGAHFLAGCKRTVHRLAEGLIAAIAPRQIARRHLADMTYPEREQETVQLPLNTEERRVGKE